MKIQRCNVCDSPTGRCEEDMLYIGHEGPLCETCYEQRKGDPMTTPKPDLLNCPKPYYAILFEDADRRPEIYQRREDAAARYNALRGNWNCHLFVQSNPPPAPEQNDHSVAMAFVQRHPTNEPWKAELELATMLADRRASPPAPAQTDKERAAQLFGRFMTSSMIGRNVEEFASAFADVRAEETERCAKVCDRLAEVNRETADEAQSEGEGEDYRRHTSRASALEDGAAAIRGTK